MLAWVVNYRPHPRRTSPYPFGSHSHFGSHLTPILDKSAPFFSCTYELQISQPFCFAIHTKCPGVYTPLEEENHEYSYISTPAKTEVGYRSIPSPKVDCRNYDCENLFGGFAFFVLYLRCARGFSACARGKRAAPSRGAEK